jgi:hypothetical protein
VRPVFKEEDDTWSIYATWYDTDDRDDAEGGGAIGWTEDEVPEWTGLRSEAQELDIIQRYNDGTLPSGLMPEHPHSYT